jgi:uncharacterized membrane protein
MASVEESIDVNVDVPTAYDQWTHFEEFPRFMDGVISVRQVDERRLHWVADIAGRRSEWDAEITERVPDQRLAWTSADGRTGGGIVTFTPMTATSCRVTLRIVYEPEGFVEPAGNRLGLVGGQVRGDLERFKDYVERRGEESADGRGELAV